MASPRRGSGAVDFCGGSIERTNGMKNMPWLPARSVRPYMGQGEHSNSGAGSADLAFEVCGFSSRAAELRT